MVQTEETEKQRKARERREARETEANAVLDQAAGGSNDEPEGESSGDVPAEGPIDDTSEDTPSESSIEDNEVENEAEVATEGFPPEDPEVIIVPPEFEGTQSVSAVERSSSRVLAGETPVMYRGIIEFNPPRTGMKKNAETGTREMNRIEFFFSDPHVFYWLYNRVSKGMPDGVHPDISRAEAVALDEGSAVIWRDRNQNERA